MTYLKYYENFQFIETNISNNIIEFISKYLPSIRDDKSLFNNSKAILFLEKDEIKSACIYQVISNQHIHISYISTDIEYRGRNLSSEMIIYLKKHFRTITTFVRESNLYSLNFFKKNEFFEVGRVKLNQISEYSRMLKFVK